MPGPAYLFGDYPVLGAIDPWGFGFKVNRYCTEVQRTPSPETSASVISCSLLPADSTPAFLAFWLFDLDDQDFLIFPFLKIDLPDYDILDI
ncbi:hypothetical protein FACS189450_01100 [Spirochaetia bacterium]|nr:hypothetical protein FACS189450_01100 [Spirochaetia bacterium]